MAERKAQGARRLRRLAGVVGGVTATALCLSFAWSVVGSALRPAAAPLPDSIVIAAASHQPGTVPQLPPFRKPAPVKAKAKYSAHDARKSAAKTAPEKIAPAQTPDTPATAAIPAISLAAAASSLLRAESNASRTRGQPAQD